MLERCFGLSTTPFEEAFWVQDRPAMSSESSAVIRGKFGQRCRGKRCYDLFQFGLNMAIIK